MADYDIFREQLAIKYPSYGHALWEPSPRRPDRPVQVGDVGFIRRGKFHRLFNALLPADDPSHELGVPEYYEPLVPTMLDHVDAGFLGRNHYCSAGVSVDPDPGYHSSPDDFPQVSFQYKRTRGAAVLSLPVAARREDTLAQGDFRRWMVKHIDSWFAFARNLGLGIEQMEDVILVTGCDRTRSWTNIAFLGSEGDAQASFGVKVEGPGTSINFQFSPERARGAVLHQGPEGTNLPENQCVFIRGFRAARSFWILPRRLLAAAGPSSDMGGYDYDPDTEVISIPAISKYRDPLHLLLEYIAEQASDCDMVLTHDDDLLTIDGLGHDASLETLKPDVMMDLLRRSNIEIHKVLCDLSPTDSGPNTDTSVVKVATLSITSQKWNTPTPTRSSPLPLQNFDPGHASGSGDVSISSLPGSLPVPTIQGDTSKRETSLPADHGDSARPFPPISLLSSFSRNISRAFNQILIDKPFDTIEARVVHEKDLTLQRQLEHIQADFSSTKMELEHQRSANALLVSQKGQLSVELAQACAARQAQATEVHNLRTSYVELANSVRTLESSGEELRSHKSILTKTDGYSGQQMVQAVHDLNTEIFQLAAAVSDEFPLTRRSHGLWKDSHCEFIREAIGDGMLALLRDGDHEDDPTIVQLAVRAWEIWCCSQVFDAFCPGAPPEVDRFLHDVFREMQSSEPQATTSRWRTLTHMYARSVASAYNAPAPVNPGSLTSSSLISPISLPPYPKPGATANDIPDQHIFALPMPRSRTPSNAFASSLDDPSTRTGDHISGILAILSLAGCTDEHAVHIEPLHARFGEKLSRIAEQTEALARMLGEGVSSAWFEVVVERPSVTPPARSKGRAPDVWLGGQAFDPATMENMYAGYGSEVCGVLCTVAFGLSVVKRRKEGEAGREQPPSYLDMKSEAGTTRSKTDLLESTLLLKPKVLLESVKELL